MDYYTLFIYFMIYSFLGWVIETIYCSIAEKRYVPRGFLNGPLTPIYGFGAVGLLILLQEIKNASLIFAGGVVATSLLEYLASYLLELIFDMHWWDYSGDKYNLNGRIKLKNSILFGLLSIALIYFIHPEVVDLVAKLSIFSKQVLALTLLLTITVDTLITVTSIFNLRTTAIELKLKNFSEEARLTLKNGYIHKRLLKTFPRLAYRKDIEIIDKLRLAILNKRNNRKQ